MYLFHGQSVFIILNNFKTMLSDKKIDPLVPSIWESGEELNSQTLMAFTISIADEFLWTTMY